MKDKLQRSVFSVKPDSLKKFRDNCSERGVTFWRGFEEAVEIWVSNTQKQQVLTQEK